MRIRKPGRDFLAISGIVLSVVAAVRLAPAARPVASKPTTQPATRSAGPRLTVATYNMNYAVRDANSLSRYVRIIRKAEADVVAIQEGNAELWAHLKRHLAKDFSHMRFYPGPAASGFAWLSKTPLQKPVVLPKSHGWFSTPTVQIELGGRKIRLVNIHLRATLPPKNAGVAAVLKEYGRTELIRVKEIRHIHARLSAGPARDLPTVLLGDFNSIPTMNVPQFLRGEGYTDSLALVGGQPDTRATWHWPMKHREVQLRLDYVWHDANFRTRSARVLTEGPSDHWPVVCELELTTETVGDSERSPARLTSGP